MEQLKLSDIALIHNVNQPVCQYAYIDSQFQQPLNNNTCPEISFIVNKKTITLTRDISKYNEDEILKDIVNQIVDKRLNTKMQFNIDDLDKLKNEMCSYSMSSISSSNVRKLISRVYAISNLVAIESRIGAANSIVVDNHKDIFYFIEKTTLLNYSLFYHKGLGDKIIIFRKPTNDNPHWAIFNDSQKFEYSEIGDSIKMYQVFKLEGYKQMRNKKLQRILNDSI
ncbi:MAG: hypothetical protein HPY57_16190 [Ignavibacteria bacterium]|nr:hypothetical protein [Ignavibacteria bacterium]